MRTARRFSSFLFFPSFSSFCYIFFYICFFSLFLSFPLSVVLSLSLLFFISLSLHFFFSIFLSFYLSFFLSLFLSISISVFLSFFSRFFYFPTLISKTISAEEKEKMGVNRREKKILPWSLYLLVTQNMKRTPKGK